MAVSNDDEKVDAPQGVDGAAPPSSRRKGLLLGGGVLGLVASAWILAMVAIPAPMEQRGFAGPFAAPIADQKIQVNLMGEGSKRFLIMSINALYDAYDEAYVAERKADPLYLPLLQDALIEIASRKSREQVTSTVEREVLKQEIEAAVDPILFPLHLGDARTPYAADRESGLRLGQSLYESTLRGPLGSHRIAVSSSQRSLTLDDGPAVEFQGTEHDLRLESASGEAVYVDLTALEEGFEGAVPLGVQGRVREVVFSEFLVQ